MVSLKNFNLIVASIMERYGEDAVGSVSWSKHFYTIHVQTNCFRDCVERLSKDYDLKLNENGWIYATLKDKGNVSISCHIGKESIHYPIDIDIDDYFDQEGNVYDR